MGGTLPLQSTQHRVFAVEGPRVQHLHLVGFTAELDGLIFSARRGSKSGGFVVELDDRLLESISEAVRLHSTQEAELTGPGTGEAADGDGGDLGRPEGQSGSERAGSGLSPKEIQARLRAGRTVEDVAEEAEVDEAWILRFAAPVLAEQSQIVERAIRVPCRTARRGESAEPLADAVAHTRTDRDVLLTDDELAAGWSAYHVRDSSWVVRFRFHVRRRDQLAKWAFDVVDGTVVPLNRLGTELGFVDPARQRRKPSLLEAIGVEERRAEERRTPSRAEGAPPSPTRAAGGGRPRAARPGRPRRRPSAPGLGHPVTGPAPGRSGAVASPPQVRRPAAERAADGGGRPDQTKKAAGGRAPAGKEGAARKAPAVRTPAPAARTPASAARTPAPAARTTAKGAAAKKVVARPKAVARPRATGRSVTVASPPSPPSVGGTRGSAAAGRNGRFEGARRRPVSPVMRERETPYVAGGVAGEGSGSRNGDGVTARRQRPLVAVRASGSGRPLGSRAVGAPAVPAVRPPDAEGTARRSPNGRRLPAQASARAVRVQADRAGQTPPAT